MHRPIATALLIFMAALFLVTYPFRQDPIFGFLMHVSGAAMIGGLADWYAVTALFSKPLGISFKTALIPRSKGRLIETARYMMVEELLRVPHMYRVIKTEQLPEKVLLYFISDEGHRQWSHFIGEITTQLAGRFDVEPIRTELVQLMGTSARRFKATPVVLRFGRLLLEAKTAAVIWTHVNRTLYRLLTSNGIRPYLEGLVGAMMSRYAEDSFWRELALALGSESFSPQRIADLIQQKGGAYLLSQQSLQSPMGQYMYHKALAMLAELEHNEQWQQTVESWKNRWLDTLLDDVEVMGDTTDWSSVVVKGQEKLTTYLRELVMDKTRMRDIERFLLYRLVPLLRRLRPFVDASVVSELDKYTPKQLAMMMRSRLYHDLQMIRINGSLVGAVLGGVFYLVAYWLGGTGA